jgi:hypothetical protein
LERAARAAEASGAAQGKSSSTPAAEERAAEEVDEDDAELARLREQRLAEVRTHLLAPRPRPTPRTRLAHVGLSWQMKARVDKAKEHRKMGHGEYTYVSSGRCAVLDEMESG